MKLRSRNRTPRCKYGSMNFNKEQLNDDFCDCPDGTGTSAFSHGKFYCQKAGHAPVYLSFHLESIMEFARIAVNCHGCRAVTDLCLNVIMLLKKHTLDSLISYTTHL